MSACCLEHDQPPLIRFSGGGTKGEDNIVTTWQPAAVLDAFGSGQLAANS